MPGSGAEEGEKGGKPDPVTGPFCSGKGGSPGLRPLLDHELSYGPFTGPDSESKPNKAQFS